MYTDYICTGLIKSWMYSRLQPAYAMFLLGLLLGFLMVIFVVQRVIAKRERKRLSELQDQFVALGSHYLLTPVAAVQAAVARLQEVESMNLEERRKLYAIIAESESRLWIITQQLLLVSQLGNGELHLEHKPFNLGTTLLDAMRIIGPSAQRKQVKFSYIDLSNTNTELRGDERRLKQALIAVIDNAVKFSPEGSEVKITLSSDPGFFQIVVADQGIGISRNILGQVKDKFFRGTDIYHFDYEGLGLGLFIAQEITGLHQGILNIESVPKSGTRAIFEFPKQ